MVNTPYSSQQNTLQTYCCIVDSLYPVLCVHHGNKVNNYAQRFHVGQSDLIVQLEAVALNCKDSVLIRAIQERIFEQIELKQHQFKPQFWLDISLNAISANWRTPSYYDEKFYHPENIVSVIEGLDVIIQYAEEHLHNISIADCFDARKQIDRELSTIQNVFKRKTGMISKQQYDIINKYAHAFSDLLSTKLESQKFFNPWGKIHMQQCLTLRSGIEIDIQEMIDDTEHLLTELGKCKFYSFSNQNPMHIHRAEVQQKLNDVFTLFQVDQQLQDAMLADMKLYTSEDLLNFNVPLSFVYLTDMNINSPNDHSIVFFNEKEKLTAEELTMKIVHEIFPGHFFENWINGDNRIRTKLLRNSILSEGWAIYCEYLMAKLSNTETIQSLFIKKFHQISIMAYAALILQDQAYSLNQMIVRISQMCEIDHSEAKNILIQADQNPLGCISYLLGFAAVIHFLGSMSQFDIVSLCKKYHTSKPLNNSSNSLFYKGIRLNSLTTIINEFARGVS